MEEGRPLQKIFRLMEVETHQAGVFL